MKFVLVVLISVFSAPSVSLAQESPPTLSVSGVTLAPPAPPPERYADYIAKAYSDSGRGDFEQALDDAQKGLAIAKRTVPANRDGVSYMRKSVIAMLLVLNRDAEARHLVQEELRSEGQQDSAKSTDVAMAQSATETANALEQSKNPANVAMAPRLFQKALDLNTKAFGRDSDEVATTTFRLGNSFEITNKSEDAEEAYRKTILLLRKQPGVDKSYMIAVEARLADLTIKDHRYAEAAAVLGDARALEAKQVKPDPDSIIELRDLQKQLDARRASAASEPKD